MQFYDSEWGSLKGQYIVVVRDNEHAQLLMKTEYQLMSSFIKNVYYSFNQHIPVVYSDDVSKITQPIQLILDYFNQPPINEYQVISYQSLINRSVMLKSIIKKKPLRKGSCEQIPQTKEDRFFTIMNIDKKKDLKQQEKLHSLGEFTSEINDIVEKGFADEYQFAVLIVTYEKLGFTHIELLKQAIKIYIRKKEQRNKIIHLIRLWLNYRFVDLVNDNSVFCTMFLQFLKLLELIEPQQKLYDQINSILNGKMQTLTSSLNSPSPTSIFRKQSFHRPKKQKNFRNLSVGPQQSEILESDQETFNGNQFYLNTSVDQLQKQLWIIDVEMFSKLSATTLLDSKSLIKYCKNQEISDYFDYLLFHMILSTILCSKDQRYSIISKFIELNCMSKEAKHYQLMHLIYCYFTHQIIQQIMNKIYPLNPTYQQKLGEIMQESYKAQIPIDVNDRQGVIPCLSQIQLYVYRFQDIYDKQYQLIESKQIQLAQQVFQICHLQFLIRQLNGCYHQIKDELICRYLRSGIKNQLQSFFKCNKQSLEIQMFKIYNQM